MTQAELDKYARWIINTHRNFKTINLMDDTTIKVEAQAHRAIDELPDFTDEELKQIVKATWDLYNKGRDRAKKAWKTRRR